MNDQRICVYCFDDVENKRAVQVSEQRTVYLCVNEHACVNRAKTDAAILGDHING